MNTTYNSILKKIEIDITSYKNELEVPATENDIQNVIENSKKNLNINLPEEYLTFLKICNGLDYNGTVIYATDRHLIMGYDDRYIEGIISANMIARDVINMNDFLIFGESDGLLHVLYLPEKKYRTIESIGLTIYENYDSFDQLLDQVLNEAYS